MSIEDKNINYDRFLKPLNEEEDNRSDSSHYPFVVTTPQRGCQGIFI